MVLLEWSSGTSCRAESTQKLNTKFGLRVLTDLRTHYRRSKILQLLRKQKNLFKKKQFGALEAPEMRLLAEWVVLIYCGERYSHKGCKLVYSGIIE